VGEQAPAAIVDIAISRHVDEVVTEGRIVRLDASEGTGFTPRDDGLAAIDGSEEADSHSPSPASK
jgi:hypothetical protein